MIDPRIQSYAIRVNHLELAKNLAAWRQGNDIIGAERGGELAEVSSVSDHLIKARDGANVAVRVYRPKQAGAQNISAQPTQLPVYVFFHGGGWVIGSIQGSDYVARALANSAQAVVVSVDYRMSPEYTYPTPLNDCQDALNWVRAQSDQIGVDRKKVVLSGDSAGGHLALTLALREAQAGTPVAGVFAIYPCLDPSCESGSANAFADGHGLTKECMRWFWQQYLGAKLNDQDADLSPWFANDLSKMPLTWILTASHDPLRDEAETFARRLADAGVPVAWERQQGMLHGFIRWRGIVPHADQALRAGVNWLNGHLVGL